MFEKEIFSTLLQIRGYLSGKPLANRSGPVTMPLQPGVTTQGLPVDITRIGLIINNAGANPARFSFGVECSPSTGITLPTILAGGALARVQWDNPVSCPKTFLSLYSELGTTIEIIVTSSGDSLV